jgi:hypothetical protein
MIKTSRTFYKIYLAAETVKMPIISINALMTMTCNSLHRYRHVSDERVRGRIQ